MSSTVPKDISELAASGAAFRKRLAGAKRRLASTELNWYPYDTLHVLTVWEKLLTGANRDFLALVATDPVLDAGCADGDLAFYLESLGCAVDAIDYPATNFNQMRGIAALREALHSSIELHSIDLDGPFTFPGRRYGLAICLGLLYHLKNPYYLLEQLAQVAHYCLISTRVARLSPDHKTALRDLPVAYLLDECEANDDATNYWVFSETGLKRILKRTGWQVCDFLTQGSGRSDPASAKGDERAHCLLRNPALDRVWRVTLLQGWHMLEEGHYRWTQQRFSIKLESPQPAHCKYLSFAFYLPKEHLTLLGPVTLSASLNGHPLANQTFTFPGDNCYKQGIPAGVAESCSLQVDFTLDKAIKPTTSDSRELGLVVSFARSGCAVADANLPLQLS